MNDIGYRLDFYDNKADTFLSVKRNHHYKFIINKVKSAPYVGTNYIWDNPGSNLEYTVTITDEATNVISNGQYAIATNIADTVYVEASVDDQNVGFARYQLGENSPAISVYNSVDITGNGLSNGTGGITLLSAAKGNIIVSAATAFIEGRIVLKYGNITKTIAVKKL
jgi:hypothetical protein